MPDPKPFAAVDAHAHWVRPRPFRIRQVDLAVRIDLDARRIEGEVVHHVELPAHRDPRAAIELDQQDLDIRSVEIDGEPVPFSRSPGRLSLAAPAAERFTLRVRFAAEQPAKGMHFVAADASAGRVAMCWTQGAMEDHHWWFPCFDDPNNLATYRFAITHRSDLAGIANGRRERTVDAGEGWSTTTWVQDKPHVLYLVNVAVGAFVAVEDASGPVPITHWLPRGYETQATAMFRSTAFAIRWLSGFIGVPFAWERYGHLVVHGFMWGGMENTTLTTITDRVLMDARVQEAEDVDCDSLVIHELVHQWFGDLLTMKGWADIWLNESFATYLEARGTAAWRAQAHGRDEADALALELWGNRREYLEEDGQRYRRALVTNRYADAYELFDRVAYEKGSLVLHHLCRLLGEERFRAGLRLYVERHAHDLVETADFRQALEDATGEPLDWFIDQWTGRAGHPTLKVRVRHDAGHGRLLVDVEQVGIAADHQAWRLPTVLAWRTEAGIERLTVDLRRAKETLVVACAQAPRWTALDPDGELPAEWDEDDEVETLLARAGDGELAAQGRARAVVALAGKHPSAR
ncbi:MAG: M1 family metallopeptidase, partial [Planctomycetes bacterium]|nr:M1 family metallopeptidase [Planctomycetota bacterium]